MENDIENKICEDGYRVASSMQDNARKGKKIERYCVYTIIATAWAMSYKTGTLTYNLQIKVSLILGILWVFLDILYYLGNAIFYKYLLVKYFKPTEDSNFTYKNHVAEHEVSVKTKKLLDLQVYYSMVLAIIMLMSAFFMGLSIFNLPLAS